MTIRLSASKSIKVQKACKDLVKSKYVTVRDVAHVIGLLVSSLPAVQFGALYYRRLELNKITALRQNQGDYDAVMNLSEHSKAELLWWINNITQSQRPLITSNPDLILTTDGMQMFLTKQPKSSSIPGQMPPSSNTTLTSKPGPSCVVNGRLILMIHL